MTRACFLFILVACLKQAPSAESNIVARVDGLPIQKAELNREMTRYRAEVYAGHPVVPSEFLQKRALAALVKIKVQEIMLVKYQLWPYADYVALLNDLEQTNASRRKAASQGNVLYGPVVYDEMEFFDYRFSIAVIKLKQILKLNESGYSRLLAKAIRKAKLRLI